MEELNMDINPPMGGPTAESYNVTADPGYQAFQQWTQTLPGNIAGSEPNVYRPPIMDTGTGMSVGGAVDPKNLSLAELASRADASKIKDTSANIFKTNELNLNRFSKGQIRGVDEEERYAQNQSTGEKAYNGVAKGVGIATTTFINGTAGLVYGLSKYAETGKVSSFYNNDLTNYLNTINEQMEDSHAHYKTQRERDGAWYEPSNLFSANFLFDNIVKNLGFSAGAWASGFAWSGAFRVLGMAGKLVGTTGEMASAVDEAIATSTALPATQRAATMAEKVTSLYNKAKTIGGAGLANADRAVVATFGTFGEAGMEALGNSQEYRKKAIDNFRVANGYDPTDADLAQIDK